MSEIALSQEVRDELTDPRSDMTAEDRVAIAMAFLTSNGSPAKAAHRATSMLGKEVRADFIRQWKRRSWWEKALEVARGALQKELDAHYTSLLHYSMAEIEDRIKEGEYKLQNGEIVRVPVTLRDLIGAHAIVSDKRAMVRGEPTSRKEDTGTALAAKLLDMLDKHGRTMNTGVTIEGEVVRPSLPSDNDEPLARAGRASPQEVENDPST